MKNTTKGFQLTVIESKKTIQLLRLRCHEYYFLYNKNFASAFMDFRKSFNWKNNYLVQENVF